MMGYYLKKSKKKSRQQGKLIRCTIARLLKFMLKTIKKNI